MDIGVLLLLTDSATGVSHCLRHMCQSTSVECSSGEMLAIWMSEAIGA
jgi:hypothetical protein